MNEKLSKDSFPHEVIDWLRKNNFDETVVKGFEGESINGKDFFELEMWMIERMIKGIKEVKRFRTLWSKETSQTFDGNGMPVQSKQPCAIVIDSHTDDAETMTPSHRIANPPSAKIGTTPSCHRMIEPISPEVPTEGSPSNFTVDEIPKTPCSFTATSTRRGRSGEKNVKFGWVQFFEIPDKFSVNVEMGLASKNLNGNQRNEFNRDICTLISTHTRYPTEAERQIIAQKIVAKYPFLKDPKICSTSTEWGSWEQKIKHRMKRLQRNPLKHTQDCKPNTEGESIGTPVVKKIKLNIKPWLKIPPLDEGETEDTMKEKTQQLKKICRIARPDQTLVKSLMSSTYPVRRKMILEGTESVDSLLKLFPPLLQHIHLKQEMCRVMGDKDVTRLMKERLIDTWLPKILSYVQKSEKSSFKKLVEEMDSAISEDKLSPTECNHRTAIFAITNYLLRCGGGRKNSGEEKVLMLLKTNDNMDALIKNAISPIVLLSGLDLYHLDLIYIAGEHKLLCDLSKDDKLVDALVALISCYYVYDFDYTMVKNVMIFLEHAMLSIEPSKMPVRVTEVVHAMMAIEQNNE